MTGLWPLYRALAGLGIACAALVAVVHQATAPIVAAKRLAALEAKVQDVVPGTATSEPWSWLDGSFVPANEPAAADVWVARDETGLLVGLAVEGRAMGYQDTVRLLWGYDPRTKQIVGMRILESRETPGLGDRVDKDPDFLAAFRGLPAEPGTSGEGLLASPTLASSSTPAGPTAIDAITGATISSRAVVAAVAGAAETWVPRLVSAHESDVFKSPPPSSTPESSR